METDLAYFLHLAELTTSRPLARKAHKIHPRFRGILGSVVRYAQAPCSGVVTVVSLSSGMFFASESSCGSLAWTSPSSLPWLPSLSASVSVSFAMTLSNCDHSASTELNSLPTFTPSLSARARRFHISAWREARIELASTANCWSTYRRDALQIPVQPIQVLEDMF